MGSWSPLMLGRVGRKGARVSLGKKYGWLHQFEEWKVRRMESPD
jgi:hypothetical protein